MSFCTALVTGSSGLLGRALVDKLLELNIEVTCLARKTSPLIKEKNIQYKLVENFDQKNLIPALHNIDVDVVFHLAAYGVHPMCVDPAQMFSGNVAATTSLMIALSQGRVGRIIYTGSCSEYGITEPLKPIPEKQVLRPVNLYGTAKAVTHIYCQQLARELVQQFITLRLFNVYGPGEKDYRLIPYLIKNLMDNKKVDLTPGKQVKDFLYIDDVIEALIIAAKSHLSDVTYNICSGKPITIWEIATEVAHQLKVNHNQLVFGARPYRKDETMWLVGDNSKFRKDTDWQPKVSIKSGISKMIESFTGK